MVNKGRAVGLKELRVVITGASGGIGAATSTRLRAEGARVIGIDLVPGEGILSGDITDADTIQAAVDDASRLIGGIDVLVNGAGIGEVQDAGGFPDEHARRVMEVNFWGTWQTTAAALPHLLATRGHVINVVSGLAAVEVPYAAAYIASKKAIEGYSQTLRLEYRGRIHVTNVYPGYIKTPIHDRPEAQGASLDGIARAETVEQAAAAIARACRTRPRRLALTRRSAVEYWLGRHAPRLVGWIVAGRVDQVSRQRPRPPFLRFPEVEPWTTRPS
jgi:NAD(P)-dependent dehydrogenase (short-subunit alcohol dehydrogenase family)